MIAFRAHPAARDALRLDPDALPTRDRAVLRILARSDAATAAQLATLVYGRRRTAQERLQVLWHAGLLERAPAPQHRPGTSPYAYRLSPAARRRLGIAGRRPAGPTLLRHTLDGVAVVSALVAHDHRTGETSVQAWLPERIVSGLDLGDANPDGLLVLQVRDRSGVVCLEVDEGTEHAAVIRPRLHRYATALRTRRGWVLLFVVPSQARAAWLARLATRDTPRGPGRAMAWAVVLDDVDHLGLAAPVVALASAACATLADILPDDQPRRTAAPVGSAGWVSLLGTGGGERLAALLRD